MKRNFCWILLGMAVLTAFSSCRDPIFADIQEETKLRTATIPGGPTDIFRFKDHLYTASGKIYRYGKETGLRWRALDEQPPGGKVLSLTAAGDALFVLTSDGKNLSSAGLYRQNADGTWPDKAAVFPAGTPEYSNLQSVYGAGDRVFVGAYAAATDSAGKISMTYGILSADYPDGNSGQGHFRLIYVFEKGVQGNLTGAYRNSAGDYYIATGAGLYSLKGGVFEPIADGNFLKLLPLQSGEKEELLGIVRASGSSYDRLWYGGFDGRTLASPTVLGIGDRYLTAAAGIYEAKNAAEGQPPFLLLLGRGRSPSITTASYHGYYEIPLNSDGTFNTGSVKVNNPGNDVPVTSVDSNAQYAGSLEKEGINSIFQAPADIDPDMPVFASTQKTGLWSLRYNTSRERREWNVEE